MNDIINLSYDVILERLRKKYSYEISVRKYCDMIKCRRDKEEHMLDAQKKEEGTKGMINLQSEEIKKNKINLIYNVTNEEVKNITSQEKPVDDINEKKKDFDEVILSLYTDLMDLMNYNNFFIKDCVFTFILDDKDGYKGKLDLYFVRIEKEKEEEEEEENKNCSNDMAKEYLNSYDDNKEKDNVLKKKKSNNNIYDNNDRYIFFEHYEIYGNIKNNIKDILRNTFECLFFGIVEEYNIILKINYCNRIKEIYNYILFNEEIYKSLEYTDYIKIDINKIHFDIIDYSFIFSKNIKKFVNYLKYVKDIHSCSYFISLLIRNIAYINNIYKYTSQLFIYNNSSNEYNTIFLRFDINNKKEIFEKIGILKKKITSENVIDIDICIYDNIKNIFINKYNMSFPEEHIILSYVQYYYVYKPVNMKKYSDYNTNYSYIFSTKKNSDISNTTHIICSSDDHQTLDLNYENIPYIKSKPLQKNIRKYMKCKETDQINVVKDMMKLNGTQEIYDDDHHHKDYFYDICDTYDIYDTHDIYDTYDDDKDDDDYNYNYNYYYNNPNPYERKQNHKHLRNNKKRNNDGSMKYKKLDDHFNKEESIKKINGQNKEYNYDINKYNSDSNYMNNCITSIIYDEKENQKEERTKYTHNSTVAILNNKNCSSRQIVTRSMKYKTASSIETDEDSKSYLNDIDILDDTFIIKENIVVEKLMLDDELEKMLTERMNEQNDNIVTIKNRKIKPLNLNMHEKDNYINFYSDDNEFDVEINKCVWANEDIVKRNKRKRRRKKIYIQRQIQRQKQRQKQIQREPDNINNYMINEYHNNIYQDIIICDKVYEHVENTCNNKERFYNDNFKMKNTYNYKKRPYNYITDMCNKNVVNKRRKISSLDKDENFTFKKNYENDKNKMKNFFYSEFLFDYNPWIDNDVNKNLQDVFYEKQFYKIMNENFEVYTIEDEAENKKDEDNKEEDNKEEDNKEEDNKEEDNKEEDNKEEDNKEEDNKKEDNKDQSGKDQFIEEEHIKYRDNNNNNIIKKLIEVYNIENDSVTMYIVNNEDENKKNQQNEDILKKDSNSIDLFNRENKKNIKNKTYTNIKNINMNLYTNKLKKCPNNILKKSMMHKNIIKEKMNNEKYKNNKINNNQNKNKNQCKNYFIDHCNNNKKNNNNLEIISMNNTQNSKYIYNHFENKSITESVYNDIMKKLSRNMYFLNHEDNIFNCVSNYKHLMKKILYFENVIEKYNIHMRVIPSLNIQSVRSNRENKYELNENNPNKLSDGNYNKNKEKDNHMDKLKNIIHNIKNKCREYKNTLYKYKRYMCCKYIYGKQNCSRFINSQNKSKSKSKSKNKTKNKNKHKNKNKNKKCLIS
ncbi:conserved Plasmodium protein, unknown function [Plasmodium sp. DRC-Itaito]|nr:conserved Plasmodium protein, unknown function [Plasmodium sp. DRC-Itaito]